MAEVSKEGRNITWIHLLFCLSGFPALIYQIVWQRALFAIYGLNIQSVTIVVSGFMLGLGLGSLAGGALSSRRFQPLVLFAIAELFTGIFGAVSLRLFHHIAEFTAGKSLWLTGLVSFSVIVLSTLLMGATLPLLVEYFVRSSHNVGSSVGGLYFANNLGSALACFLAAAWLMRNLGESGSVRFAAVVNASVATGALVYAFQRRQPKKDSLGPLAPDSLTDVVAKTPRSPLPYPFALGCAAFSGFAALSYEILWYRVLAFGLGDTAAGFALLLGAYLFGLAIGSRFIERSSHSRKGETAASTLSAVMFVSSIAAFAVSPLSAWAVKFTSPDHIGSSWPGSVILLPVCISASFFGATFPLLAHVSVNPTGRAGASLSYLYAANIIGSTLGTLLVGYVLMDYLSVYQISILLLVGGVIFAAAVFKISARPQVRLKPAFALAGIATTLLIVLAGPLFSTLYDRLLFKNKYPALHFHEVIETRSGTIGVTPDGTVFGGGVYDGRFNVDLLHDVNMIVRPYALSAFQRAPHRVLMIGLGSGSWAQVLANHPQVENVTVVEINPGYLKLISEQPTVATILRNPKVHIVIDDARRWLSRNPQTKYDAILMNTSFYWRNHSSNLLSVEFLQIARKHLEPSGVLFYNATGSDDVLATASTVYPYVLRFLNCVAVSDSPLIFDRDRWRAVLLSYVIDGKHVVDASDPKQLHKLDDIVGIPQDPTGRSSNSFENNDQLRSRLQNRLIITDDNMGSEWR
ncbi:MAG: fused MFS/spermidine synthase [Candidatus Sulfotelmatobacter sp.]